MVTGLIPADPDGVGFFVVNTQWEQNSLEKKFRSLKVVRFGPVRYGPQVYKVCIDWPFSLT